MVVLVDRRTVRRRSGDRGERLVQRHLAHLGWAVIGSNVVVGRDEIDLVAVDSGPPRALVFLEVRSNVTGRFGGPEESVAGRKVRRTYRAAFSLLRDRVLPSGVPLPNLAWRVDVFVVEQMPALGREVGGPVIRHLRGVTPD
jgi:Holliday junction resolvase-like predicted endonuclease